MRLHSILLLALASCACGRGATPTPAPAPSPDAATSTVDAPPADSPDAGERVAAPPSVDAGSGGGGGGYATTRLIKCVITTVEDNTIGFTCERAVKPRWKGDLWNDVTDEAIEGSRFEIVGARLPDRLTAATRLPKPLSDFGLDIKTVRIVEQY